MTLNNYNVTKKINQSPLKIFSGHITSWNKQLFSNLERRYETSFLMLHAFFVSRCRFVKIFIKLLKWIKNLELLAKSVAHCPHNQIIFIKIKKFLNSDQFYWRIWDTVSLRKLSPVYLKTKYLFVFWDFFL